MAVHYKVERVNPEDRDGVYAISVFRAGVFREEGIYRASIYSDMDLWDLSRHTHLLAARNEQGDLVGTVRIIQQNGVSPRLPVFTYYFCFEGDFFPFNALPVSRRAKQADSQVAGLAIAKEYQGTRETRRIIKALFECCYEIGMIEGINNGIICARPSATRLYKKMGARTIMPRTDYVCIEDKVLVTRPVDTLFITLKKLKKGLKRFKHYS